jgi:hypothetical protein
MKKHLVLFSFLLIAFSGFSQESRKFIGLQAGAIFHFPGEVFYRQNPLMFGIFYDQPVFKRFGLNAGVNYASRQSEHDLREAIFEPFIPGPLPEYAYYKQHELHWQVNLTYELNKSRNTRWKHYLIAGYTRSLAVVAKETLVYPDHETINYEFLAYTGSGIGYVNLGFETRFDITPEYNMAIGAVARINDLSSYYRESALYCLNLKFGRNL